jgi:SAUR family protein
MNEINCKKKSNNLITKTWERCKSFGRGGGTHNNNNELVCYPMTMRKSKSLPSMDHPLLVKRPEKAGCFSVYVGPEKQRFVIKTKFVNHPLFRILLEEAESEYGFISDGPLVLPCKADLFCKVLLAMEDARADSRFH